MIKTNVCCLCHTPSINTFVMTASFFVFLKHLASERKSVYICEREKKNENWCYRSCCMTSVHAYYVYRWHIAYSIHCYARRISVYLHSTTTPITQNGVQCRCERKFTRSFSLSLSIFHSVCVSFSLFLFLSVFTSNYVEVMLLLLLRCVAYIANRTIRVIL